jgi:hypothetical protein
VGDTVSADDVVETGADGAVEIELRHNRARWALAANQSKQVSASTAWRAAPRDPEATGGGDRTAAAGRHAEREAADTSASAVRTGEAAEPDRQQEQRELEAKRDEARKRLDGEKQVDEGRRKKKDPKKKVKVHVDPDNPLGEPDDLDTRDAPKPTEESRRKATSSGVSIGAVTARGGLDRDAARDAVAEATGRVEACTATVALDAAATFRAVLQVGVDGAVTGVSIKAAGAVAAARDCVREALGGVAFPAASEVSTVTVTYEVNP